MMEAVINNEVQANPGEDDQVSAFLSDFVDSIGRDSFIDRLLDMCNTRFGADHCAIFQLSNYKLSEIASASLDGAELTLLAPLTSYEVKRQLSQVGSTMARVEVQSIGLVGAANRPQQIMISAQRHNRAFCIGIVRSDRRRPLTLAEMKGLRTLADLMISVVARHIDLIVCRPQLAPALSSLNEIQDCVLGATDLSRREAEVCSRILYGMSSYGIALDLGIGKESVMTYRKRAYQRLGIATQRELLMWYLTQWSAGGSGPVGHYAAVN